MEPFFNLGLSLKLILIRKTCCVFPDFKSDCFCFDTVTLHVLTCLIRNIVAKISVYFPFSILQELLSDLIEKSVNSGRAKLLLRRCVFSLSSFLFVMNRHIRLHVDILIICLKKEVLSFSIFSIF